LTTSLPELAGLPESAFAMQSHCQPIWSRYLLLDTSSKTRGNRLSSRQVRLEWTVFSHIYKHRTKPTEGSLKSSRDPNKMLSIRNELANGTHCWTTIVIFGSTGSLNLGGLYARLESSIDFANLIQCSAVYYIPNHKTMHGTRLGKLRGKDQEEQEGITMQSHIEVIFEK